MVSTRRGGSRCAMVIADVFWLSLSRKDDPKESFLYRGRHFSMYIRRN